MADTHQSATQPLQLWDSRTLGQKLSLSKRQIFRLNSAGKIPAPVRIGGAVRWRADECAAWLTAGAPDRKTWETIKGNGGHHV